MNTNITLNLKFMDNFKCPSQIADANLSKTLINSSGLSTNPRHSLYSVGSKCHKSQNTFHLHQMSVGKKVKTVKIYLPFCKPYSTTWKMVLQGISKDFHFICLTIEVKGCILHEFHYLAETLDVSHLCNGLPWGGFQIMVLQNLHLDGLCQDKQFRSSLCLLGIEYRDT